MSRRKRRERPATPAEQRQVQQFTEAADIALSAASMAERRQALNRMRRVTDRLTDPDNLANLTGAELHNALTEKHQYAHYGAPQSGRKGETSGPARVGEATPSTTEGAA